jgi:hypothetical protein
VRSDLYIGIYSEGVFPELWEKLGESDAIIIVIPTASQIPVEVSEVYAGFWKSRL